MPPIPAPERKSISPAAVANPNPHDPDHMVWSFRDYDTDGPYCLTSASLGQFVRIIAKLRDFEGMSFRALQGGSGQHFKRYQLETLAKQACKRLAQINHDDEDCICRLRLGGRERLYGFLRGNVFEILWWDPDHAVCPSHLKNT